MYQAPAATALIVHQSPLLAVAFVFTKSLLAVPLATESAAAFAIVPLIPSAAAGDNVIVLFPSAPVLRNVNYIPILFASIAGKVITFASVAILNSVPA